MDFMASAKFDIDALKEPRGFIRVIQVMLAIFAFGTIVSVQTEAKLYVNCSETNTSLFQIDIRYGYPFRIHKEISISVPFCSENPTPKYGLLEGNFSSSAEFFACVGVLTFLALILLIPAYVFFGATFNKGSLAAKADFVGSVVWTVLWFIASTAWADNLSKLSKFMEPATIIQELTEHGYCKAGDGFQSCSPFRSGDHSTLIVSVLFGYLNMGLQGAALWFLFKETDWHHDKDETAALDGDDFQQPYADPGYQTPEYSHDPTDENSLSDPYQNGGQADYYSPSQAAY